LLAQDAEAAFARRQKNGNEKNKRREEREEKAKLLYKYYSSGFSARVLSPLDEIFRDESHFCLRCWLASRDQIRVHCCCRLFFSRDYMTKILRCVDIWVQRLLCCLDGSPDSVISIY
jgi:hypothetical protein